MKFLIFLLLLVQIIYCKVIIRTVAGIPKFGGDGKFASKAFFNAPRGVFVTHDNELYITEFKNNAIRKIDKNGIITTVGGIPGDRGYAGDFGVATNALFYEPSALYVTNTKEIYICDSANHAIRKIFRNTTIITIAGGITNGPPGANFLLATSTRLKYPNGIFVTEWNNEIFVSDTESHVIRKIATNGTMTIVAGVLGQFGYNASDTIASQTLLHFPQGIFVTSLNELYMADSENNIVRKVFLTNGTMITIAGVQTYYFTCPFFEGEANALMTNLCNPTAIHVVESTQELFVADNCAIRKINLANGTISYITGQGSTKCGYSGDYQSAKNASIVTPYGMTVSSQLEIYIPDMVNNVIRKIGTDGIIRPFAGVSGINDVTIQLSKLIYPSSVVLVSNQLYISDYTGHTIKKFDTVTGKVSIIAGLSGMFGYNGTNVLATNTLLNFPTALVWNEAKKELYFCDRANHLIRKINRNGTISIVAGTLLPNSVGPLATQTKLLYPQGLSLRNENELYIADGFNSVVRRLFLNNSTTSIIAGQLMKQGYTGDGGFATNATLIEPSGLFATKNGEVYIGDGAAIRKVFPNGTITTFLKSVSAYSIQIDSEKTMIFSDVNKGMVQRVSLTNGTVEVIAGSYFGLGYTGDEDDPKLAKLSNPMGIFVTPNISSIYIADAFNGVIRKVGLLCDNYSFDNTLLLHSSEHYLSIVAQANRTCLYNTEHFEPNYLPIINMQYKSTKSEFQTKVVSDWNSSFEFWNYNIMSQWLDILQIYLNDCSIKYGITNSCVVMQEYAMVPSNLEANFLFFPSILSTIFIHYYKLSESVSSLQIILRFSTNQTETMIVLDANKQASTFTIPLQHSTTYSVQISSQVVYTNGFNFSSNCSRFLTTLEGIKPTGNVESFAGSFQNGFYVIQWNSIPENERGNMPITHLELIIFSNSSFQSDVQEQRITIPYDAARNVPSSYFIDNLANDVNLFQIRACNEIGCGEWNEPIAISNINLETTISTSLLIGISISLPLIVALLLCIFIVIIFVIICLGVILSKHKKKKNSIQQDQELQTIVTSKEFHIEASKIDFKGSKFIGSGVSGSVITANYFTMQVAIKLLTLRSAIETEMSDFYNELQFLNQHTQHGNIIRFFGVYENREKNHIGLVMEYCPNGNVANYVSKSQLISLKEKLKIIQGIANGMQYLHHHNIAHRDLKCENVLLDSNLNPKIIDFGYSKIITEEANKSANLTMNIGTAAYCAPEVIQLPQSLLRNSTVSQVQTEQASMHTDSSQGKLAYDKRCDVYSFAIVMWVIYFQNKHPYGNNTTPNQILYQLSINPHFRPRIDANAIPTNEIWLINLIQRCWNTIPQERPSFDEICQELVKECRKLY